MIFNVVLKFLHLRYKVSSRGTEPMICIGIVIISEQRKQDEHNVYVIMKTMCPSGYHHNGFVATHALGYMMYSYTLLVPMNQRMLNKLCKDHNISGNIYIYIFIYIYILYISYIYIYAVLYICIYMIMYYI